MWFVVLLALMLGYILGVIQHRPTGAPSHEGNRCQPDERGFCWSRHGTHPNRGGGQVVVVPHVVVKPMTTIPRPPKK